MKIKEIISQYRRDFTAIYECEHCGATKKSCGYDDDYFHRWVIPEMSCEQCGKKGDKNYRPLATKYPASAFLYNSIHSLKRKPAL
jgi:transcription elongation factor Elf1